ncbi:superfamily I helicase [Cenarchaeum symbiosum A]|uniref:DNA 3'-5' helicase n=1 Tax=Cenarchaeum symbiosum (strain A) TaxID=414004 RepID=A0RWP5_CENSY|nr:superfamily I helicase [Cenarchaeum symbiosum A]
MACPGSGKTETVSRRIAELIKKGAAPSKIVAFTFTNRAADSLRFRINRVVSAECGRVDDLGSMYVGTIDSYCLQLLKELKPEYRPFEILDEAKQAAFVDRWYLNIGLRDIETGRGRWDTLEKFCRTVGIVQNERLDVKSLHNKDFVRCYRNYAGKLEDEKFFDFSSVVHMLLGVLENDAGATDRLNSMVEHVVFDEYQDVNHIQEDLLSVLSKVSDSVCVVGDDDQNIFNWRGSNFRHIREFDAKYDKYGMTVLPLNTNYRSTGHIIKAAASLIQNNLGRLEKDMRPFEGQNLRYDGGDIVHGHFETDLEEFGYIEKTMKSLFGTDFTDKFGGKYALSYADMAVLVRTNKDASRITKYLEEHGIPVAADSSASGAFETPVVKLALDCLFYAFNCPGMDGEDAPLAEDLCARYKEIIGKEPRQFAEGLGSIHRRVGNMLAKTPSGYLPDMGLQEFFQRILNAMGLESGLLKKHLHDLGVLSTAISDYEYVYQTIRAWDVPGFRYFVKEVGRRVYPDRIYNSVSPVDAVRVMTIWKAKGLEFPAVFVPTFVKFRKIPLRSNFLDPGEFDKGLYTGDKESARRVYYTAVTRSQKYLFLTGATWQEIAVGKKPSKGKRKHPFISEMGGHLSEPSDMVRAKSSHGPREPEDGVLVASYRELSTYGRCPHDFFFENVAGFKRGILPASGYVTSMHNILGIIHEKYARSGKIPDPGELEAIIDETFHLRFAPLPMLNGMKKKAVGRIRRYLDKHADEIQGILEVEKRFEVGMDKTLVTGVIDLLRIHEGDDGRAEVADFITEGERGYYESDHHERVKFGTYAALQTLGLKPGRSIIHYLDRDEKDYVDISDEELKYAAHNVGLRAQGIHDRNFDATPSETKCRSCDFRAICDKKDFTVGVDFDAADYARREGPARGADAHTTR